MCYVAPQKLSAGKAVWVWALIVITGVSWASKQARLLWLKHEWNENCIITYSCRLRLILQVSIWNPPKKWRWSLFYTHMKRKELWVNVQYFLLDTIAKRDKNRVTVAVIYKILSSPIKKHRCHFIHTTKPTRYTLLSPLTISWRASAFSASSDPELHSDPNSFVTALASRLSAGSPVIADATVLLFYTPRTAFR